MILTLMFNVKIGHMASLVRLDQFPVSCLPVSQLKNYTGSQLIKKYGLCLQRILARGGMIPYTQHQGKLYLGLGQVPQTEWSDFAGSCQKDENILQACLREYHEESNSAFGVYTVEDILPHYCLRLYSYICILVPAKYDYETCLKNFQVNESNPEVLQIRWFEIEELKDYLISNSEDSCIYMYLRILLNNGLANWQQTLGSLIERP